MFYVTDPSNKRWLITIQAKHIPCSDKNHDINFDITGTPSYATHVPTSYEKVYTCDVHVIRYNHEEDIWKN